MSTQTRQAQEQAPLAPNIQQQKAANPAASVWVSASAGTGKTKVLTDRVLRLLLPRNENTPGSPAHRIMGLTFTKAAAGEMALRLQDTLAKWAIMPEDKLTEHLESKLLGREPRKDEIEAARRLFAEVIDTPDGLKIMTIHSFCQSVLSRFPIEAGLPPGFEILDEREANTLLERAMNDVLCETENQDAGHPCSEALNLISTAIHQDSFINLLKNIAKEREQLRNLHKGTFDVNVVYQNLCNALNIIAGHTSHDYMTRGCADDAFNKEELLQIIETLKLSTTKTDALSVDKIAEWVHGNAENCIEIFNTYRSVFLKKNGDILAKFASKKITEAHPKIVMAMSKEAKRLQNLLDKTHAAKCAFLTRALLMLGHKIITRYQSLKLKNAVLDYDDMIFMTLRLLKGQTRGFEFSNAASWVMYKLDQGLDHLLIDEAQDTNPEQWQIIEALCDEFVRGQGARELPYPRTIFVVGDEKQSIYSFQRASPEEFRRMQADFKEKIETIAQEKWENVSLDISFRSTPAVLHAVDAVFSIPSNYQGLGGIPTSHRAWRNKQAGLVELWPLFEAQEKKALDLWEAAGIINEGHDSASELAEHIAATIRKWIDTDEKLPSQDRSIKPGDILILVRTRSALVKKIVRALKIRGVPIEGIDRMVINDEIAVQDLLAITEFTLLPEDDLTLACVLKSPLIGMDENELLELAYNREGSLWAALQNSEHTQIKEYLGALIHRAHIEEPFTFLSRILQESCPVDKFSGLRAIKKRLGNDAIDPLHELLRASLTFARIHPPSLQGFIHWQKSSGGEIKREMEESSNQVRIMTVHGAKGLQAPIIIMPDTVRSMKNSAVQNDRRLLWPDKTDLPSPIWSPRKDIDCKRYSEAMRILEQREDEEYARLLYVAMTRAESRLYIAGCTSRKKPLEDSWYFQIKAGLESCEDIETLENGTLRLTNPQEESADKKERADHAEEETIPTPNWLWEKAPEELTTPAPLMPSRPTEIEPSILSPLQTKDNNRFRRGNLTHKLLEILPEIPEENRENVAKHYLKRQAHDLGESVHESILSETMTILTHPEFAPLFGNNSSAEVPITARLEDGRIISGQIDRLLITDDEIMIIDYKTNRPPPNDPEDIPALYRNQLKAYADTLSRIYPKRHVRCALLWTDTCNLMEVKIEQSP